ncbi:MAG: hypothetical protein R2848_10320 [Thermomicrobiales bacterium]
MTPSGSTTRQVRTAAEALRRAAEVTSRIRLGVGVIPIDRRSPDSIVQAIEQSTLPKDRLIVGVGAGGELYGSLDNVRGAVRTIREQAGVPVAVGALGPRMVALAAREADAVLLNWLTPRQAKLSPRRSGAIRSQGDAAK